MPLTLLPLPDEAEIARLTREVRDHWDCDISAWRAEMARLRAAGHAAPEAIPLAIGALRVNGGILAGLPLEPFAEIARAAAERLPGVPLYVAGCANGWIGYLPAAGEYAAGGYEVEWAPTVYGLGSGWVRPARPEMAERVTEAIVRLARGAGKAAASRG